MVQELACAAPCEEIVLLKDLAVQLEGVIVIHSTRLGPAAGGCRFRTYSTEQEMTRDGMRLAEGMSYKNALAGLPLGGGKTVIRQPAKSFDRPALFRALGDGIARLQGRYITAEDVGTSVKDMLAVASRTAHVVGLPPRPGAPGGDPSPWTARGVFGAMKVAARRRLGTDLAGLTIGVQGLGHVGYALCELLHDAGARLVIAEARSDVAARAAVQFGAHVMTSASLIQARLDVFAPCALGAVLTETTIKTLRAAVVCGAANNQLAHSHNAAALAQRDVLYAPDYVVNAGGIINVAAEHFGWSIAEVEKRVDAIATQFDTILSLAEREGTTPHEAAGLLARSIMNGQPASFTSTSKAA